MDEVFNLATRLVGIRPPRFSYPSDLAMDLIGNEKSVEDEESDENTDSREDIRGDKIFYHR